MEVLFFRIGPVLCGLPTEQIVSLEKSEHGTDLAHLLGNSAAISDERGRCVRLRGSAERRIRIDDVLGIQAIRVESISPLPSLVRKKLKSPLITGVVWHREEGALLLDVSHVAA